MLYVDDLLPWQNEKVLPLSAALILAFCSCFRIPLSWRKLQLGPAITWIGWEINFGAECFTLPEAKRIKLLLQLQECLHHRLVSRKQLDRLLGLLQWILHGFPALRPWLCSLYDDMHRPLGTNVSVSPTFWPGLHAFLDERLRFTDNPPGTGIDAGSTLLSARHRSLQSKADLALVPVSTKRIWLRVADPTSSKRRLSQDSRETLEFFTHLAAAEDRDHFDRPPPRQFPQQLMLLARPTIVVWAAGFAYRPTSLSGFLTATMYTILQLWDYLCKQTPTLMFPAMRHWHSASSYSLSGSHKVLAAWLSHYPL